MLKTRVITALVLVAILGAAAAWSVAALLALGAGFLGVMLFEWLRLAGFGRAGALCAGGILAATALALETAGLHVPQSVLAFACAAACAAWLAIGIQLVLLQRLPALPAVPPGPRWGLGFCALVLAAVAWLCLADLLGHGALWTLSVIAPVWIADIAAYFGGRAFGVRKLASHLSPGKTWAGVWAAMAAVVTVASLVAMAWPGLDLWSTRLLRAAPVTGVLVLLLLVALSVVGDLFESLVKRQAGAKDSGKLLPGHGGVWDRIDATLPALPLAVLADTWLAAGGILHG